MPARLAIALRGQTASQLSLDVALCREQSPGAQEPREQPEAEDSPRGLTGSFARPGHQEEPPFSRGPGLGAPPPPLVRLSWAVAPRLPDVPEFWLALRLAGWPGVSACPSVSCGLFELISPAGLPWPRWS